MTQKKDLKEEEQIIIDDLISFAWEQSVLGNVDETGLIIRAIMLIRAKEWTNNE